MTTMSHLAFAYSGVSSALPTTTAHHQVRAEYVLVFIQFQNENI